MKQLTIAGVNVNALTKEDLVEITPDMARKYLQKDNNNIRRVSTAEVNKYAKMLKSDEWHFNGDTIAFDETGRMKDGQHRIHAIHRTGQSLYTFPVLIADDTTIDNKKRLEHTIKRIQDKQIEEYSYKYRHGKLDEMIADLEKRI